MSKYSSKENWVVIFSDSQSGFRFLQPNYYSSLNEASHKILSTDKNCELAV